MKQFTFYFLFILLCTLGARTSAEAATLSVTPAQASVSEGSTFSVTVRTDTQGRSVNVAEATVGFSTDTLEIVSVSSGATFTLQTPGSPSKTASSAYFSAGIPSGYTGSAGTLGRITFRAKKAGKGTISVTSGKVLLNDGNATNALNGTTGSVITITPKPVTVETPEPIKEPEAVVVPVPIENPAVPETPIVVTPTEIPEPTTVTIRTKDLFTLIYILIGIIFILLGVIIALIVVLARRKPVVRKSRTKKEKQEVRLSDI